MQDAVVDGPPKTATATAVSPLHAARTELERIGFRIAKDEAESVIAVRSKFHWDCMFTKVTYVVFARHVANLDPATLDADRARLETEGRSLDPSMLPRGLQKGTAVLTAYYADAITPEAVTQLDQKPKVRFAFFYMPGARQCETHPAHFIRSTPMWGALYYSKFRWVLGRLLEPTTTPEKEPLSMAGGIFTLFLVLVIALNVALLVG